MMYGNIVKYSQQKFSSNVVETSLKACPSEFIARLLQAPNGILELMKNKYGSFVLRKILLIAETRAQYQAVLQEMSRVFPQVNLTKYKEKWAPVIHAFPDQRHLLDYFDGN
jgi:hypothetical protein